MLQNLQFHVLVPSRLDVQRRGTEDSEETRELGLLSLGDKPVPLTELH